jgi:hypothetical protein
MTFLYRSPAIPLTPQEALGLELAGLDDLALGFVHAGVCADCGRGEPVDVLYCAACIESVHDEHRRWRPDAHDEAQLQRWSRTRGRGSSRHGD